MSARYLRLNLRPARSAAGYGLVGLEAVPVERARTEHEFFHNLAHRERPGWYPKYWLRRQSDWTPVGGPHGTSQALINEEGMALEITAAAVATPAGKSLLVRYILGGDPLPMGARLACTGGIPGPEWRFDLQTMEEPDPSATAPDKTPKMRDLSLCPCKSRLAYGVCCAPFHYGKALPQTAEQLMRSRYSAYFFGRIDYLVDTTHPDKKTPQTRAEVQSLADEARWKFLTILSTSKGQAGDKTGKVEFIAQFYHHGVLQEHHEKSRFRRSRGLWKYVDDKG